MNQIINSFMLKYPKLVKEMQLCDHAYSETKLNPYHIEGTVWCHTMMVCKEIEKILEDEDDEDTIKELWWSALLHDIGKPSTRYPNHNRGLVTFMGHESLGIFKSIDILNDQKDLSEENIVNISLLVGLHSYLQRNSTSKIEAMFNKNKSLLTKVEKLYEADNKGRYTILEARSSTNKYHIRQKIRKEKEHTINIMIGPPLSGKTTFVNKISSGKSVISKDALLKRHFSNLGNSIKQIKTNFKQKDEDLLLEIIENELKIAIKKERDIYIDANNLTKQEREIFTQDVLLRNYKKKAIVMFVGYEELIKRNRTKKRVPNFIIEKECKRFMIPFYDEFDEIEYKCIRG